jgi:TRIC channel
MVFEGIGLFTSSLLPPKFPESILSHDMHEVSALLKWIGFAYVSALFLLKPKTTSPRAEAFFWGTNGGLSAYYLAEVTWIPMLATIVHTRTSYPYLVVIPHCIAANFSYRVAQKSEDVDRLQALVFGFFLYGFGGSIVSDVLLGLPVTALAHHRIIPCHILGWYLVWFSPMDWVYVTMSRHNSFLRYFIGAAEAVDAVTTPMGRISRASRELSNKTTAPIGAGVLAGIGGAILRYLVGTGSYAAVQAGIFRTLGYSLLFWWLAVYRCDYLLAGQDFEDNHCPSYSGSDSVRIIIVSFHVIWVLLCEGGWATSHPFVWLGETLFYGPTAQATISALHFGPQRTREKQD